MDRYLKIDHTNGLIYNANETAPIAWGSMAAFKWVFATGITQANLDAIATWKLCFDSAGHFSLDELSGFDKNQAIHDMLHEKASAEAIRMSNVVDMECAGLRNSTKVVTDAKLDEQELLPDHDAEQRFMTEIRNAVEQNMSHYSTRVQELHSKDEFERDGHEPDLVTKIDVNKANLLVAAPAELHKPEIETMEP